MHLRQWRFCRPSYPVPGWKPIIKTPPSILRLARYLLICAVALNVVLASAPVQAESNVATATTTAFGIEYAVPNGPRNIVEEAPNRIWYTATDAGGIGVVEVISDTATSQIRYRTDFYGLGEKSMPYDLDYHEGVVWFTLRGIRSIGRIDTTTRAIKTYPLLTVGAAPTAIDVDPSGIVWIGQNNGRIARFDPVTEEINEFLLPDSLIAAPRIEQIVYRSERAIWFTMPEANVLAAYDSVRDRFLVNPTGDLIPTGMTFDDKGVLWVTAYGTSRILRFTPTTLSTWIPFDTPTPNSGPAGIIAFTDAQDVLQIWVAQHAAGSIGRVQIVNNFDVASQETVGSTTPPGNPWGVIRASNEHIWVADTTRNVLYEIKPPYIQYLYLARIMQAATGSAGGDVAAE